MITLSSLWNNPQPGGAYHLTVNLFDGPILAFQGVRTFAFDRAAMLAGNPSPTAIAFTVPLAGVGDSYSFVPATFRTGTAPPAGRDEMVLAIDSPATGGVTLTQVHARFFHVDFVTPANSTLGLTANTSRMPRSQSTDSLMRSRLPQTSYHSRERRKSWIRWAIKS